MKKILITIFVSLSFPALSYAGGSMATLVGKCTKFVAMGVEAKPSLCANKVVNMDLSNGRNGFGFFLNKDTGEAVMATFFGDGRQQVHTDKDHAVQPIDRVRFTFKGSTDDLKAVGSCSFANPYMGKPVSVSCQAKTTEGVFAGEFISNGVSPNVSQF